MKTENSKALLEHYLANETCNICFKLLGGKLIYGKIIGYTYADFDNTSIWQWHVEYFLKNGISQSIYLKESEISEVILEVFNDEINL